MLNKYNDVISVEELCDILHIGKNSAYKLLQSNIIYHKRIGRKYIIPKQSVIKYLQQYK